MLKRKKIKQLIEETKLAVIELNEAHEQLDILARNNYQLKNHLSKSLISKTENIVAGIGNLPLKYLNVYSNFKEASDDLEKFYLQYESNVSEKVDIEESSYTNQAVLGTSGAAIGVSISTLGPTAATAIASTYGVASTGTAITALSGAAAQSATLAWLGGGSLAAGGGGMAAGTSLLAIFGPVGIAASAISLLGSATYSIYKDSKKIKALEEEIKSINLAIKETIPNIIENLNRSTDELSDIGRVCNPQFKHLKLSSIGNFNEFNELQKEELNTYMKTIKSLSVNLNGTIHS